MNTYIPKYLNINGLNIRYYQTGEGPDVLLLHALMGDIEDWNALVPLLSQNCRVTLIDRPGFGLSTVKAGLENIDGNVLIIEKIIKILALKNVVLVGHSYSGAIALKMAINHSKTIHSYVLIAPTAYPDLEMNPGKIEKLMTYPYLGKIVFTLLNPFIGHMIGTMLKSVLKTNPSTYPKNFISTRQKLWNKAIPMRTQAKQKMFFNIETGKNQNFYSKIQNKVYLVYGDSDNPITIAQCKKLEKDIPNVNTTVLKRINHYVQFEAPESLRELILTATMP